MLNSPGAKAALQALQTVIAITGQKKSNIVGFCAGGILSAIVAACSGWTARYINVRSV